MISFKRRICFEQILQLLVLRPILTHTVGMYNFIIHTEITVLNIRHKRESLTAVWCCVVEFKVFVILDGAELRTASTGNGDMWSLCGTR